MASLDTELSKNNRLRMFFYGPSKTKKTWLAGTAAEAGFNVLMIEGDGNFSILKNLASEARKRISIIQAKDRLNKAVFAELMAVFLETNTLIWDEVEKIPRLGLSGVDVKNCSYIDKKTLDSNWVLILDSYTALVQSITLQYCLEHEISLSDAKKPEWDGYGFAGRLATWMIQQLKNIFNCHIIVIGHAYVYDKTKLVGDKQVIDWSRTLPVSTSGRHGLTIAKNFTDVLYFSLLGSTYYVDARASADRDGGAINFKPERYKWEDFQFKNMIEKAGLAFPPADLPYPDFSISDELFEKLKPKKTGGKLNLKTTAKVKPGQIKPETQPAKETIAVTNTKQSKFVMPNLMSKLKDISHDDKT